jgi:hypothetical protein
LRQAKRFGHQQSERCDGHEQPEACRPQNRDGHMASLRRVDDGHGRIPFQTGVEARTTPAANDRGLLCDADAYVGGAGRYLAAKDVPGLRKEFRAS